MVINAPAGAAVEPAESAEERLRLEAEERARTEAEAAVERIRLEAEECARAEEEAVEERLRLEAVEPLVVISAPVGAAVEAEAAERLRLDAEEPLVVVNAPVGAALEAEAAEERLRFEAEEPLVVINAPAGAAVEERLRLGAVERTRGEAEAAAVLPWLDAKMPLLDIIAAFEAEASAQRLRLEATVGWERALAEAESAAEQQQAPLS
jgi:hypothetical protein